MDMPRKKTFQRDEVLQKAVKLFWKQGYHATSMQDLVDHLGINRSSIYDTFESKENLFLEALREYRRQNSAAYQGLSARLKEQNVLDFLHSFLKNVALSSLRDPDRKGCFMANCTAEVSAELDAALRLLMQNKEAFVDAFAQAIYTGQQRGEIRAEKPPEYLASYLFTFLNGLQLISRIETDPEVLLGSVEVALSSLAPV